VPSALPICRFRLGVMLGFTPLVAISIAQESADPEANIIFGSLVDENVKDEVKITVIATGFVS
jgi:hypothetical protein